jgi:hypothetical protein
MFLQLLEDGCGGFQFTPSIQQVLTQFVAFARQCLKSPMQFFHLMFVLFRRAFAVLAGAIHLQ